MSAVANIPFAERPSVRRAIEEEARRYLVDEIRRGLPAGIYVIEVGGIVTVTGKKPRQRSRPISRLVRQQVNTWLRDGGISIKLA